MRTWIRRTIAGFVGAAALAVYAGIQVPLPTDLSVAMDWAISADQWIVNHAALPGLFMLFAVVGLALMVPDCVTLVRYLGRKLNLASAAKVELSDPIYFTRPKDAPGRAPREYKLEIRNRSGVVVKNCRVKKASFINSEGNESDSVGLHFRLSREPAINLHNYRHAQEFDIPPWGFERVDIAMLDETQANSNVVMLYATLGQSSEGIRNSIPRRFFPHILVVQVTADNLSKPEERKYRLYIDAAGILRMDHVSTP